MPVGDLSGGAVIACYVLMVGFFCRGCPLLSAGATGKMYDKYYLMGNNSDTILQYSFALAGCGVSLFVMGRLAPHRGGGAGAPRGTRGVAGGRKK